MEIEFEWDPDKAKANWRKHGVLFQKAILVFSDPSRIEWLDQALDYAEERWITIGFVEPNLLTVVFTVLGRKYRLISARKATRSEQSRYEDGDLSL